MKTYLQPVGHLEMQMHIVSVSHDLPTRMYSSILKNLLLSLLRFPDVSFIHGTHSLRHQNVHKKPSCRNIGIAIFNCKTTVIYARLIWRPLLPGCNFSRCDVEMQPRFIRDYLYLFLSFYLHSVK